MLFKYTLVYQIQGLIVPDALGEVILLEELKHSCKALLSNNLDKYCTDLDKRAVINKQLMVGLGEQSFESHLEVIKKQRNERYKTPPFLIIEILGEDSSFILKNEADKGDYILCLQNDTGNFNKNKYQDLINNVISSLCITIYTFYKVKKVGAVVVYFNDSGKPIHNMNLSFKGTGFTSRQMLEADDKAIKNCLSALLNHEAFSTVCRLLVQSIDNKSDDLLSYLSAWTAFEVFVHKTFKLKKKELIANLTERGLYELFLEEIEKDKFSLMSKFKMMCLYLSKQSDCSDVENFKKLKDIRDNLLHGDAVDLNNLPIFETQNLLRKYLFMYIDCVIGKLGALDANRILEIK